MVLASLAHPETEAWQHLAVYVLPELLSNTVCLVLGVGCGTLLLGVPLAWLTAIYRFPGQRVLSWALALPLAMPAYVLAFVQIGLYDYTGPLQSALRAMGWSTHGFPPIRSGGGAVLTLTLSLYPYVYLLARQAFSSQGLRVMEAAQSLGLSHRRAFWRVALPMARPWLIGGVSLALMETLADFGTVATFNFDTLTTAIYKTWFGLFNLNAAAQLASLLVLAVLALALADEWFRGRRAYGSARLVVPARRPLPGWRGALACAGCVGVLLLALGVPLLQLLVWANTAWRESIAGGFGEIVLHSLTLAGLASVLLVSVALLLALGVRRRSALPARLATLGYAVPGTVLAVGVIVPVAWLDSQVVVWGNWLGFAWSGGVLKGTLLAMLFAYLARFLAVAYQPVQTGLERISLRHEDAAASLGLGFAAMIRRLHMPMLRGSLASAVLLVFVDVMKEMPMTLMTRPFGWNTLSVRIFELTSEGQWEAAALPAIALVVVGLLPVGLLAGRMPQDK